jgi:hypothetical protein
MPFTSRVAAAALVVLLASGSPAGLAHASSQDPNPPQWFLSMLTWLAAVNTHEPGQADAALGAAVTPQLVEFEAILTEVLALGDRLVSGGGRKPIEYRGRFFQDAELRSLMGIRKGEPVVAGVNRLLRRAAVFHLDAAMLGGGEGTGRSSYIIRDGQQRRRSTSTVHWQFGRELIDRLQPDPARDPFARAWYLASAARLQSLLMVSEADDHLSRARQIFPNDADVLFRGACALETLTAPSLLAALGPDMLLLRSPGASRMVATRPSVRSLLDRAEQLFRRALRHDPSLAEARVRLARLIGAKGERGEANDLLMQALAARPADDVRYLALMLLGDAQMAVGRRAEARARYEEAADLYPTAQSPLLALGLLARDGGDRETAAKTLERLSRLPPEPEKRIDPTWVYYTMQGRDADRRLQQVHALIGRDAS